MFIWQILSVNTPTCITPGREGVGAGVNVVRKRGKEARYYLPQGIGLSNKFIIRAELLWFSSNLNKKKRKAQDIKYIH